MKLTKATLVVFLGLVLWVFMMYLAIAFIEAETNPFAWDKVERVIIMFMALCYLCFSPLFVGV